MRFSRAIGLCGVLAVLLSGSAALAQTEQWLQYRTGNHPQGYQNYLSPAARPDSVALPELGGTSFFFNWTTPMDASGKRLIVLTTQPGKAGICDRLYIDTDGDSKLDDEKPLDARRRDSNETGFDPVRITFKGEDGTIAYHLLCEFRQWGETNGYMYVGSAGWYEGNVDFAGKKRRVQMFDANVNGVFNDRASTNGNPDFIMVEGDETGPRALGRLLDLNGRYYRVEVARDGAWIKVAPAENLQLAKVRAPESISAITVSGENGQFQRKPAAGEFSVPAGTYAIGQYTIDRADARGAKWQALGVGFAADANFEAHPGSPAKLSIGEPFRAVMSASGSRTDDVNFQLKFLGAQSETIHFYRNGQRPKGPSLTVATPAGASCYSNTFAFG